MAGISIAEGLVLLYFFFSVLLHSHFRSLAYMKSGLGL